MTVGSRRPQAIDTAAAARDWPVADRQSGEPKLLFDECL
jgi:hypothetical protein